MVYEKCMNFLHFQIYIQTDIVVIINKVSDQ